MHRIPCPYKAVFTTLLWALSANRYSVPSCFAEGKLTTAMPLNTLDRKHPAPATISVDEALISENPPRKISPYSASMITANAPI